MTAAIFGLLGVVIGGLLNAGVTHVFNRSARRRAVRRASRLALQEYMRMSIFAHASRDATDDGGAVAEPQVDLMLRRPATAIREHLPVLAEVLTTDEFGALSNALLDAEGVAEGFFGQEDPRMWTELVDAVERAEKALEPYR